VNQAIQDGIGQGRISDLGVPFIHRQLSGNESGTKAVPIFEEFQKVPALFVSQVRYAPVVQGNQIDFGQGGQELRITPIAFGDLKVLEKTGETEIANRVALTTGFVGQGTGQEGFTASGRPGDEDIMVLSHPVTGSQLGEQGFIQAAGVAEVDILQGRLLAQSGLLETGFQAAVFPVGHFPVDEQTQAFFEAEGVHIEELLLVFEGPGHTSKPQGLEFFECGMNQHSSPPYW
jgi:hypothetical protein